MHYRGAGPVESRKLATLAARWPDSPCLAGFAEPLEVILICRPRARPDGWRWPCPPVRNDCIINPLARMARISVGMQSRDTAARGQPHTRRARDHAKVVRSALYSGSCAGIIARSFIKRRRRSMPSKKPNKAAKKPGKAATGKGSQKVAAPKKAARPPAKHTPLSVTSKVKVKPTKPVTKPAVKPAAKPAPEGDSGKARTYRCGIACQWCRRTQREGGAGKIRYASVGHAHPARAER